MGSGAAARRSAAVSFDPAAVVSVALPSGLSKSRKAAQVYAGLRRDIVLGRLRPGAPLLEIALARDSGTSQGTVREALMRLAEDGLVVRDGYRGTRVCATTADEARELLALRLRLESLGFARIAAGVSPALLERLAERVRAMEGAAEAGDDYGLAELDQDFHLTVFREAALPVMVPVLSRCLLHMHRLAFTERGRTRSLLTSARRHWEVVEALASRDDSRAVTAIEHHVGTVWQAGPRGQDEE